MNSIQKAMENKNGEVTASTVLEQCDHMNNENTEVNFTLHGAIRSYVVSVFVRGNAKPFYFEVHYKDMKSKSLAEIYQDLIKIEGEMK